MNDYVKNEQAVAAWIKLLELIFYLQRKERYDEILADKEFSKMIEIIEEYDDILFYKDEDYE